MSRELLNKEIGKYKEALWNNEIAPEQLMQDLRDICFVEPKVDEQQFLDVVRQYDKNFAPITEESEIQKRTEIMKKAQEGVLKQAVHERDVDVRGLKLPKGKDHIDRHHYVLLRDGTLDQKQKMLDLLTSGDKKAVGEYIYNRLGAQKERLFSLLDMDDEQLVDNYFQHTDDMGLIAELEILKYDCEFTPDQAKVMQEFYDNMTRFACLAGRVDMMTNPYYAKYPIESMKVPEESLLEFQDMMANLAAAAGETVGDTTANQYLRGPTHLLAYDYYGLRTFMAGASMTQIESYLEPFGKKYGEVLWANYKGTPLNKEWVTTNLLEGKVVFVSIPGGGAKALYNTATNPLDFKLEEVPNAVMNGYMQTISQGAREKVSEANPLFLSVFTGSKQFNTMEKCMEEAQKAQKALEGMSYPLVLEDPRVQRAVETIKNLGKAHEAYMQRKEGQGLQRDAKGNLIGRSKNEVKRLAAADEAEAMYKSLKFQMEYQLSPNSTHQRMQDDAKKLAEERAAKNKREVEAWKKSQPVIQTVTSPLTEEEKSKSTKQEILDKAVYLTMPACKASNAGEALSKMQKEVVSSINLLAARAGANMEMSASVQKDMRVHMAKVALFDYLLRERAAYNPAPTADNLVAGPLEQAMNKSETATMDAFDKLANSEAFKNIIGKVTPARMEAFLNGKESRTKAQEFDKIVQEGLGLTKPAVSAPSTQPAQLQVPTNEMQQAKPKAPAPIVLS